MTNSRLRCRFFALACLALLPLAGCWSVLEPTVPTGQLPMLDQGILLLRVPASVLGLNAQKQVTDSMAEEMAADRHMTPELAEAIHQGDVRTGMRPAEIIWLFRSHPTRVRDQGPPGGHTWYWEGGRYWVRFNENADLVQAGRY